MWQETNKGLFREFIFKDFDEAFRFMNEVAAIAESQQHHPRWQNEWNKVEIWLSTHSAGGQITDKDRQLAAAIDELINREEVTKADDKNTSKERGPEQSPKSIKMFADGGSRGNPGPSASGFVLLTMNDQVIFEGGLYLGITTNNQAEYHAVRLGLEEAKKRGVREIEVYLDSLLVVNQMKGIFKIRNRDLWPIHQNIKELVKDFKQISFTHVPRELNKLADAMVNQILDSTDLGQV
jgi:ribonuclease HI